ncbi:hypothetical protein [Bordetella genomosp. 13]|uniref:Uncharacterized protein n=1 Tax=Bordetella genomosp. 13 TaxID=463040 RepID=A0A1W6Z6G6_9BORD|nr:hypothetical protein [Bordetella genomosp. 13]ARP93016.1 hypothetical protein CAL15_00650 [Bordetella genomosp. 13]
MMNPTSPERIRQDSRIVGQTLVKLAAPRLVVRALVIVAAIIIWLLVASKLQDVGRSIRFDGMQALGQQTIDLLSRINPYFWWGVVIIWSIIVFFLVRSWLYANMASARARPLDVNTLASLRASLSDESIDVLRWVWADRDEPFTIGDLQRTHQELRHNRIGKIALVREQSAVLDEQAPVPTRPTAVPAAPAATAGQRHAEPTIGPFR